MIDLLMLGAFILVLWYNYQAGWAGKQPFWALSIGLWMMTLDCVIREAWWAFTLVTAMSAVFATIGWVRKKPP